MGTFKRISSRKTENREGGIIGEKLFNVEERKPSLIRGGSDNLLRPTRSHCRIPMAMILFNLS